MAKFIPHNYQAYCIQGYEGLYTVDTEGRVMSVMHTNSRRKGEIKGDLNSAGYRRVGLFDILGRKKRFFVHRLVAEAFCPNPNGYKVVNHISPDKMDNRACNLEWCTQKHNIYESRKLGIQGKDIKLKAVSLSTFESKIFTNIKWACKELGLKPYALQYSRVMKKQKFVLGDWIFEFISPEGVMPHV